MSGKRTDHAHRLVVYMPGVWCQRGGVLVGRTRVRVRVSVESGGGSGGHRWQPAAAGGGRKRPLRDWHLGRQVAAVRTDAATHERNSTHDTGTRNE